MLKIPPLDAFVEKPPVPSREGPECAVVSFTGRGVNS
jgi:hypothetical protein